MKISASLQSKILYQWIQKVINSSQNLGLIFSSKEWVGRKWADVLTFDCFMWEKSIKNH